MAEAGRETKRVRKQVDRLTFGGFAKEEELDEFDVESSASESEGEEEAEVIAAVAKAAKAARRSGSAGASSRAPRIDAGAISALLAAAPPLVDLLIQEDSIRCITLVARDVLNLNIAAGGRLELGPVWDALACRIKAAKAAAADAAGQAAAAAAAAAGDAPSTGCEEAPAPAPQPEPQPQPPAAQGAGTRRGRRRQAPAPAPAPPPEPTALHVVQEAVAADPARSGWVKKTEAQWAFKLTARNIQGIETVKGAWNAKNMCELAVRAAAHARWGDQAGLEAARELARARAAQARDTQRELQKKERALREEELAYRLLEQGLPADMVQKDAARPYRDREYEKTMELTYWLDYGSRHYYSLEGTLPLIIAEHRRKERTRLINASLAAEGLAFFKADWRYRCFIQEGEADGLEALLALARRRKERRMAEAARVQELSHRLDAAGLPWPRSLAQYDAWLQAGEGDIDAAVQQCRLREDRELKLQEALTFHGLLHRSNADRCRRYIAGDLVHRSGKTYTVQEVVESLLDSLGNEHTNAHRLLERLEQERLPPLLDLPSAKAFMRGAGTVEELMQAVQQVRATAHLRAGFVDAPKRRPWLEEEVSSTAAGRPRLPRTSEPAPGPKCAEGAWP